MHDILFSNGQRKVNNVATILIVEDEQPINKLIRKNLELVGHTCTSLYNGNDVFETLKNDDFDLILLDIMLPGMDGFRVMDGLICETPVIFLTARDAIHDRIKGLNLGADDYLVKPFDMLELQARVHAVLRRTKKEDTDFHLQDVTVNFTSRQVYVKDEIVDFTPQEFLLIEILIKNRNIALSREQLLESAWGFDYMGDTRTIDVHIHSIRKKLNWEDVIKTVYKLGYRLEVSSHRKVSL